MQKTLVKSDNLHKNVGEISFKFFVRYILCPKKCYTKLDR